MATSSIYDTFVIDNEDVARRLGEAFKDSDNAPDAPYIPVTDHELKQGARVAFEWSLRQSKKS